MKHKKDIWIPIFLVVLLTSLTEEELNEFRNGNEEILEKIKTLEGKENRNG